MANIRKYLDEVECITAVRPAESDAHRFVDEF